MRKNYCIGGPENGKIIECDDETYVVTEPSPTEVDRIKPDDAFLPLTFNSDTYFYKHEEIEFGGTRYDLMVCDIEIDDLLGYILDGYCGVNEGERP